MNRLGMAEDEVIEHSWITKAIEGAQKKVEAHNFEIRKNVLEYDDVMNQQRVTVYGLRKKILGQAALDDDLTNMIDDLASDVIDTFGPDRDGQFDHTLYAEAVHSQFGFSSNLPEGKISAEELGIELYESVIEKLKNKREQYGTELMEQATRYFMLQTLDDLWKDHLLTMDHLREGIGLRGYGQKDPKQEYKKEGFALFNSMIKRFHAQTVERIMRVEIKREEEVEIEEESPTNITLTHGEQALKPQLSSVKSEYKLNRN